MKIRIDLKIIIFFVLFFITKQLKIYLIIMFFSAIHELGHILVGIFLGMKPDKLEIMPTGLSISFKTNVDDINLSIKKGNLSEVKKLIVAMSGPIVSLLLAILYFYIEPKYIKQEDAVYSNILIFLFNMLPLYPLDGGRILKGILHLEFGSIKSRIYINQISNIVMIILTVISSVAVYYLKNIAIFLICIFLWIITIQENALMDVFGDTFEKQENVEKSR